MSCQWQLMHAQNLKLLSEFVGPDHKKEARLIKQPPLVMYKKQKRPRYDYHGASRMIKSIMYFYYRQV